MALATPSKSAVPFPSNPLLTRPLPRPAIPTPTLEDLRRDPRHWQRAAEGWLGGRESPNTHRIYRAALQRLLGFCRPKGPSELSGSDLVAWQADLRRQGLAPATVNVNLAAISSFFRFCSLQYTLIDPATGREAPLATSNPAARPKRARVKPYRQVVHLDVDQVRALLRAPDRTTQQGLRDYALLKGYLMTGFRNTELRSLRWGDLQRDGNRMFCRWRGKGGKTDLVEFPWPVYHAIVDYLQAAGRWELEPDDYIFVALSDAAERLPNVAAGGRDGPLTTRSGCLTTRSGCLTTRSGCLTSAMVTRLVKKYARWAGLDATQITTHSLRHTAAMLRARLTDDVREIQQFLNHSHLNTTQIYLRHAGRRADNLWMQVEDLISVD
jgi:integrase/recombinase XerD